MDLKNNRAIFQIAQFAFVLSIAMAISIASPSAICAQQQENPETPQLKSEIVARDLENLSDFSISRDGETIFIAEPAAKRISKAKRRYRGGCHCRHRSTMKTMKTKRQLSRCSPSMKTTCLVGVAGFSSPKFAVTLFDLSAGEDLPIDFIDDLVAPTRTFERKTKRADSFDVLKLFEQQRGVSIVREIGDNRPTLCDVYLQGRRP